MYIKDQISKIKTLLEIFTNFGCAPAIPPS